MRVSLGEGVKKPEYLVTQGDGGMQGGGGEKQTGGTEKHTHFLYRITDSWAFYLRLHNYTNNRFCP